MISMKNPTDVAAVIEILLLAILLLCGCKTTKQVQKQPQLRQKDSVRVEYRERTIYVPDTVYFEIPSQTAERTIADSVSHLENDYASSDARINFDGTLTHSLFSKPQIMPVPTEKKIECRDSIVYRDKIVKQTETVTKQVEHKKTWWEQTQIYGFWAAVIFIAVIYRKEIFDAVVRLIKKK